MSEDTPVISGMSLPSGIEITGKRHSIQISNKGEYTITPIRNRDTKARKIIRKIPLLRGFLLVYSIGKTLATNIWRFKPALYLILAVAVWRLYRIFFLNDQPVFEVTGKGFSWVVLAIYLGVIALLWLIRKNHSIEHKLIATVQKGLEPTLENVRAQKSQNPRCGGVIVAWILILNIPLSFFVPEGLLHTVVLIALANEGLELANTRGFIGKIFYFPGYLIQKLTTTNNLTDYEINKFREPFAEFVKLEREYITQND